MDSFDDALDFEVLVEMLRCVVNVSQQLGKTASAIFYESFVSAPRVISAEEITPRLLKILESGYSSTVAMLHISDLGPDFAWEKTLADHKNLRKFSIDMLLSLHALYEKSGTWSRILNVIEKYLKFLIPRKMMPKFDAEMSLDINASILVQATSQVAKVMFESALDILLFLSYLVSISAQVSFFSFYLFYFVFVFQFCLARPTTCKDIFFLYLFYNSFIKKQVFSLFICMFMLVFPVCMLHGCMLYCGCF